MGFPKRGAPSLRDFEGDLEQDWHSEWEAGDADHRANCHFVGAEDVAEQVGGAVCHSGLIEEVSMSGHEHSEPDDASDSVERTEIRFGCGQGAECRGARGVSAGFGIEFFAETSQIFRLVIDNREHPAEEEQISGLQCLDI